MRLLALPLLFALLAVATAQPALPTCATACASEMMDGAPLAVSETLARFEEVPDAGACCGRCQAIADCKGFVWCDDAAACGAPPRSGPALFGGAAAEGTCILASAPLVKLAAGRGGAPPAGRGGWAAGEKACATGAKDPKTGAAPAKPAATPTPVPVRRGRPVTPAAATPAATPAPAAGGAAARDVRGRGAAAAAVRPPPAPTAGANEEEEAIPVPQPAARQGGPLRGPQPPPRGPLLARPGMQAADDEAVGDVNEMEAGVDDEP